MAFYKKSFRKVISGAYRLAIPGGLQERLDVMRHQSRTSGSEALFFHIPKAAGTAIANMLYGTSVLHVTAKAFRKYYPEIFDRKFTFAIMRSPYSRTLSSYHFVKQGGTEHVAVDFKEDYRSGAFDSFHTFLEDWLTVEENQSLDHVFRPQCEFICDEGGEIIVDHLGIMEDLAPSIEAINEAIGTSHSLPPPKNKMKKASSDDELTPEAMALIDSIYSKDVEIYRSLGGKTGG